MRTLIATGPVVPRAALHLMLTAALTEFTLTVIAIAKSSSHMPVATSGKPVFSFIQLVHLLGELIAIVFLLGRVLPLLLNSTLGFTFWETRRSAAALTGAVSNLGSHAVKLGFVHGELMSLLGGAGEATGKLGVDVAY
jgi:hypothetical protein